jgi:hypothetical protein
MEKALKISGQFLQTRRPFHHHTYLESEKQASKASIAYLLAFLDCLLACLLGYIGRQIACQQVCGSVTAKTVTL